MKQARIIDDGTLDTVVEISCVECNTSEEFRYNIDLSEEELLDDDQARVGVAIEMALFDHNQEHTCDKKQTWGWDEIEQVLDVIVGGIDEGWDRQEDLPNGVRVYRSDRGHLALETDADSEDEAHSAFLQHPEYREWMDDEV